MASSSANSPKARALGAELRQARERTGMSTRKLGALIERAGSHITRWEQGRLTPSEADTATLCALLGVTGDERERLLELARDAAAPDWLAPGVDRQLAALTEYERSATLITLINPMLIPGLLQTPAYATAVLAAFGATARDAEYRTMLRMGRQRVIMDQRIRLDVVIGEHALRYAPAEQAVMVEQLAYLTDQAQRDHITVRVLPTGHSAASALMGPWVLMEFDQQRPVVHLEHYAASTMITNQKAVTSYQDAADILRDEAMSPPSTAGLIADITKMMKEQEQ